VVLLLEGRAGEPSEISNKTTLLVKPVSQRVNIASSCFILMLLELLHEFSFGAKMRTHFSLQYEIVAINLYLRYNDKKAKEM
jgi:hypothetical protein